MNPRVVRARRLRSAQTNAEAMVWRRVRNRGLGDLKIKRQVPIGPYTVDFYVDAARLVIEIDGDQHADDKEAAHDATRDAYLRRNGYEVLRFWNRQVYENIIDVMDHILYVAIERMKKFEATGPSPETASPFRPLPRER